MLLSGVKTAPSACLRCHLRQVILAFRLQRSKTVARHLSTSRLLRQEESWIEEQFPVQQKKRAKRDYVYRHIHPNGRIIGKPGRRQRQTSGQLATDSLGKPSEVILMQDVPDQTKRSAGADASHASGIEAGVANSPLSPQEIEAVITGKTVVPEQEEVNASIEELRPQGQILEDREFDGLKCRLVDSYNLRQLAQYFVGTIKTDSSDQQQAKQKSKAERRTLVQATPWSPGKRPLEERAGRISIDKNEIGSSKAKLANQIMRTGWSLTTFEEEQRIGELELLVKPWQVKLLFDVKVDSKPALESFIDAKLMRLTSDIRPYRPDNIVRITARRRDAEEIARQLQDKLTQIRPLGMNLVGFQKLLGTWGWPKDAIDIFRHEDIEFIADRTSTVIERPSATSVVIFSMPNRPEASAHARRLLLSLLDLPSPKVTTEADLGDAVTGKDQTSQELSSHSGDVQKLALLPFSPSNLPRRYQSIDLYRTVVPVAKEDQSRSLNAPQNRPEESKYSGALSLSKIDRIVESLSGVQNFSGAQKQLREDSGSAWFHTLSNKAVAWSAKFPTILRASRGAFFNSSNASKRLALPALHSGNRLSIMTSQVPGLSQLLSYFEPASNRRAAHGQELSHATDINLSRPFLRATFMPSPFAKSGIRALKVLPRIEITYRLGSGSRLQLSDVKAVLEKQGLQVSCPTEAVDLDFTRSNSIHMNMRDRLGKPSELIGSFTQHLQKSIDTGSGVLDAPSELELPLPRWLMQKFNPRKFNPGLRKSEAKAAAATGDIAFPYLLERMKHIQSSDFTVADSDSRLLEKIEDPDVKGLLQEWPEGMVLRVRDIEAGVAGGRQTEVRLIDKGATKTRRQRPLGEGGPTDHAEDIFSKPTDADGIELGKMDPGEPSPSSERRLILAASRVLKLITKANAGELSSLH
ncbi:hypothetical protein KC332_g3821 [Hortaea werneckii]|uniref:Uncharacterized protein n=1 Tax=Hortaea werneckii TaxID=91943 RepID=A0A3M7J1H5_HORWE|nr:hypothetical protein KC350_g13504 [Hortaea werneckii]KAI6842960.1 hypothetical protein KC358_g3979 [Hortaea werneckii]KAI6941547.1 hypothetical protein KC341_g2820 [Hortaea werneckii]KAI6949396.1 hypothetical protein KC348_g1361 [Hortaea werneckii]KAI6976494.1 hypothetical protein KC321_g3977 [Hortaea werneckii]